MQENKEIILEWIKRADDDELNAESTLKHKDGTPALVCFVSQQMSEKYLKTLLLFYINNCPKIHSLRKLAALIFKYSSDIDDKIEDEIIFLEPFYIETRYPADIPLESFTWDMAEKAFAAAIKIKEFVLEKIK
ncbi:MAG: HEPN domain-containing protein [Patescibacteria group bacterium]